MDPQERVEAALLNFFTTANLGTLREVALREVADSVDERVKRDTPGPGVVLQGAAAPLVERVMVIVRPELGAQRLTRAAWRAARRLGAELDIVMPEGRLDDDAAVSATSSGASPSPSGRTSSRSRRRIWRTRW